ncbi:hypothetical protein JCM10908_006526 [Rhodotorula pacifica]|uniref:uncharacterized protein n=1 Tax=Rhodotorula pacifica TaxID=1495444 RepID=UPI00317107E7
MNQDAFRSLLATPARSGGSPTASTSSAASRFGIAPPKRALPSKGSSTDLKPRKVNSSGSASGSAPKPKRNPDGSLYRDRAAERRAGRDGDFADAEKLLEDFKSRSETAGVSKDVLEDQMKYLGGDEHHSILVKGLDIALLERKKAELAQRAEQELDDVEDELDAAFENNPAPPVTAAASPPPTASKVKVASNSTAGGAAPAKRKKTRDELLAELKAMRAGGGAGAVSPDAAPAGAASADSRFKPIGSTAKVADKKGKGKEVASGWKAVGASAPEGGEKKKRKKRKVVPAVDDAATITSAAASTVPKQPASPPPKAAPLPPPVPAPEDIDDDMDIFGDVGDYKGLDTDEESDVEGGAAAAAAAAPQNATLPPAKRKYFDDEDEDDERIDTSTAPTGMEDLAAKQAAANAAAAAGTGRGSKRDGEAPEEGEEREDRPMRLEGLSGAGPSVKELLEMDKAAEAEEKRQARKLKAKEKAEARRANMTEADKANQDYQKMMAHLEKKDGGGGAKRPTP